MTTNCLSPCHVSNSNICLCLSICICINVSMCRCVDVYRSVVLTSPTIATVGLSITIPLAIMSDLLFFGTRPTWLVGSGAVLVICGFVVISAEDWLRALVQGSCPCLVCWEVKGEEGEEGRGGDVATKGRDNHHSITVDSIGVAR